MDYYGFPQQLYELKFISRGDAELSNRVVALFKEVGLYCDKKHMEIQLSESEYRADILPGRRRSWSPEAKTDVGSRDLVSTMGFLCPSA
jgi:hypothetical protein